MGWKPSTSLLYGIASSTWLLQQSFGQGTAVGLLHHECIVVVYNCGRPRIRCKRAQDWLALAARTANSATWLGSGSCTSTPSTDSSLQRARTSATTSCSVAASGSFTVRESMPTSSHAFTLCETYDSESFLPPTMTWYQQIISTLPRIA